MFEKRYLKDSHLRGFEKYKYNCIDTSILSVHVMHPFWNYCVQFFPKWMAPNVLTFAGFLLTVLNFFLIGMYDYGFTAANQAVNPIPNWVWFVAAFNIFLAYTLDGIDGKQARRTGTSGPLGELFDHGLDSYSAVFIPIYMFSLFGTNDLSPLRMYFVTLNVFLNFYLPHFEKYNTGIMFLPWGYDFLMWSVTLVLALTSICGPYIWTGSIYGTITPSRVFEVILYVSAVITSHPIIINNIYKSYRDKTGKMRPFSEAIRPLIPLSALFIISTIWVFCSINGILVLEPRIYFVLIGTLFSNICCRLIVSQMSDTKTDVWNFLLYPFMLATILCCFPFYTHFGIEQMSADIERYILFIVTGITTLAQIHYGVGVVCEMCDHFKIKCFKVRKLNTYNGNNNNYNSNGNGNKMH